MNTDTYKEKIEKLQNCFISTKNELNDLDELVKQMNDQ